MFELFYKFYNKVILQIVGFIFLILTVVIAVQVLGRKFFQYSIVGYDQIIIWVSIMSVYLLLGLGFKLNQHIRVTFFLKLIKNKFVRVIIEFIVCLLSIGYIGIAVYSTVTYMLRMKNINAKAVMFNFPTWIVYLLISIGLLLVVIVFLEKLINFIKYFMGIQVNTAEIIPEEEDL